jgi:hypothetical protein
MLLEATKVYSSEAAMQADLFQYYWNNHPSTRRCIFHCPNGGTRNKIEAVQLRAQGVVKGIPDLLCIGLNGFFAIELKIKGGVVSPEQKEVHRVWTSQGTSVYVAWSYDEAKNIIDKEFGL